MTPTDSDQMVDVVNDITADWESLIRTYVPRIGSIPMCQGITWSPEGSSASSIYPIGIGARVEWKKESCPSLLLQPVPHD